MTINITSLTINNTDITITYTKQYNAEPLHNFKPNTKRGLTIGPTYSNDSELIKPFENKGQIKWFYNYKKYIKGDDINDIEFVPKIWGLNSLNDPFTKAHYKSVMTFNEPFNKSQSGKYIQTIDKLVKYWHKATAQTKGKRVGLVSLTGGHKLDDIKN